MRDADISANSRVFFKKAVCDVGSLWEVAAARI